MFVPADFRRAGETAHGKYGKNKKLKKKRDWKHFIPYYLMGLPMVIYLFINNYMPLYGLLFAFKDVNMRKGRDGEPLGRPESLWFLFRTDDAFIMTPCKTVLDNLAFLVWGPVLRASPWPSASNSIKGGRSSKIYQTSILLSPHLMSMVVVSYIVYAFLDQNSGIFNALLTAFGGRAVNWYADAGQVALLSLDLCQPMVQYRLQLHHLPVTPSAASARGTMKRRS